MAQAINRKLNIQNKSTDDIYLDIDRVQSYNTLIKKDLSDLCESLKRIKKAYIELRDHPKTKGKLKKTISKMVNGASNKVSKTKSLKNTLETSLVRSMNDYADAMTSFDELDKMAEDLGNDSVGTSSSSSGSSASVSNTTTQTSTATTTETSAPKIGDVFTAPTGDGNMGKFKVTGKGTVSFMGYAD